MELKFGGTLEIGDPILVCYGHGMTFGLFAGYGRGTIQYYTCDGIIYSYQGAKSINEKPQFYKGYIHGSNVKYRVAKVNKDILYSTEALKKYEEAIDILKQENVIK